ncbi:hypothetical protein AAG906_001109 [Vitis piasezkii]
MAKTRGGLSASPSSPTPRPHQSTIGGTTPPLQRCISRPPAKRTKFSGPGEPSQPPPAEPPTQESQIPVGIPLETVIRRPMIAGPPIEGNLDCRDRSFHSEIYFDIEALEPSSMIHSTAEDFSLDKWHHLAAYFAPQGAPAVPAPPELPRDEQLPQAQQDDILTDTIPPAPAAHPSVHIPELIHPTSPITSGAPPVMPATPAPPPSSEPTVTVSLTEFRGLVHSLQTLSRSRFSYPEMATICARQIRSLLLRPGYHDPSSIQTSSMRDTSWA